MLAATTSYRDDGLAYGALCPSLHTRWARALSLWAQMPSASPPGMFQVVVPWSTPALSRVLYRPWGPSAFRNRVRHARASRILWRHRADQYATAGCGESQ